MTADDYAPIADLYDFVGPYRDRPDVPFWVEEAKSAGGPILELGCGSGRILLPTARAGVEIVGLDSSPSMLAMCRERLAAEPPDVASRVELVEGDMRSFDLGSRRFALATIPFRAFQHLLAVEDQLACLERVRRHLVDGGRVIVDVFHPSIEKIANRVPGQEFGEEPAFEMPDGRRVVRRHMVTDHDRFEQVNGIELIYYVTHSDGREERLVHAFGMRYTFRYELEHLFARSGFAVEEVYADYDRSPFGSRYPSELVMVARKER
jgi:SAM-dependent methyltransferase